MVGDGRTTAIEAALAQAESALGDEQTTVAELTRRLQQQQDLILQLQRTSLTKSEGTPSGSRSARGSKTHSRRAKEEKCGGLAHPSD